MKSPGPLVAALLAGALLCLCPLSDVVPKDRPAKECGEIEGHFRGRFWHYYQRGNSYAACARWAEAEADYREAIKQRDRDQFMAKTYGMHFIDYFPHRELGIACFNQGRMEQAKQELELSYSQVESGRTAYYLNEIYRREIETGGGDSIAPEIEMLSPADGSLTGESKIRVKGEVRDAGRVASIIVNGRPLLTELAEPSRSFETEVALERGDQGIVIEASDLSGNPARTVLQVHVDREGPEIVLQEVIGVSPGRLKVKGVILDHSGLDTFELGRDQLEVKGRAEVAFSQEVAFIGNGARFSARDSIGNETSGVIRFPDPLPPKGTRREEPPSYAALYLPRFPADFPEEDPFILAAGTGPALQLEEEDIGDIYIEHLVVGGMASSDREVRDVRIAGQPVLTRPGKVVYFSSTVDLREGENAITVAARDDSGDEQQRQVKANFIPPAVHNLKSRLSVGIKPLEQPEMGRLAYLKLFQYLSEQDRFMLVEQERMEDLLTEFEVSQSDLADPAYRLELHKRISASCLLFLELVEGDNLNLIARLVDTETTTVLFTTDTFAPSRDPRAVEEACRRLAWKICRGYPLLEGVVVDVQGRVISTDLSREMGVKEGMQVIVFELGKEKIHPRTGKSLGRATIEHGMATVTAVQQEYSDAELAAGVKAAEIKTGFGVITR